MRANFSWKGQSAIEYLMTYGWMLLVVAIVGGLLFTVFQDQELEANTVTGFENGVSVEEFSVNSNGLQLQLRNQESDDITVEKIEVIGENNQTTSNLANSIDLAETESLTLENVSTDSDSQEAQVKITYQTENGLTNTAEGTITGNLKVNDSSTSTDTTAPTAVATSNVTEILTNEPVLLNGSDSTQGDLSIDTYAWDTNETNTYDKNGETVERSYGSTGTRNVELKVNDTQGNQDTDTTNIDVLSTRTVVEDFENGNTDFSMRYSDGWGSGDLKDITSNALNGSYSLLMVEDQSTGYSQSHTFDRQPRKVSYQTEYRKISDGGTGIDNSVLEFNDGNGNRVFRIRWREDGNSDTSLVQVEDNSGHNDVLSPLNSPSQHNITFEVDWSNEKFNFSLNGQRKLTDSNFINSPQDSEMILTFNADTNEGYEFERKYDDFNMTFN